MASSIAVSHPVAADVSRTPAPRPLDEARGAAPQVLASPTPEMARWAKRMRGTLEPGAWAGVMLVTPLAHVATQSLRFQTYLFAVFHRTRVARVGHWICMPMIVLAALTSGFAAHALLGVTMTGVLAAYYLRVALRHGMTALGVLGAALAVAMGFGGFALVGVAGVSFGSAVGVMLALSLVQALSHVLEDVPPRVNGTDDWMPLRAFFARSPLRSTLRATVMMVAGTANELWGSGRLLLVLLLDLLWRNGYQREERRAHEAQVAAACQQANPAIDFIGHGGTRLSPYA